MIYASTENTNDTIVTLPLVTKTKTSLYQNVQKQPHNTSDSRLLNTVKF